MDKQKTEWPDEARIDTIGQNGNDGEHYAAVSQECEKLRQDSNHE